MVCGRSAVNANLFALTRLKDKKKYMCGKQQSASWKEREQIEDRAAVELEHVAVTEINPIIG